MDDDRIGAIGVCGGGGYTVHAAITDHRIKALSSITGVNFGRLIREGFSSSTRAWRNASHPMAALSAFAAAKRNGVEVDRKLSRPIEADRSGTKGGARGSEVEFRAELEHPRIERRSHLAKIA